MQCLLHQIICWAHHTDRAFQLNGCGKRSQLMPLLLQQRNGEWHPVMYASRAMTKAEHNYAQIEKEALATVWAFPIHRRKIFNRDRS